jgi:hypothetical protein
MKSASFPLGAAILFIAPPAFADHVGPAAIDGSGGGMDVTGPGTLDRGEASLGLRVVYLRPKRRVDHDLEELAEQDIHAHNSEYFLATVLDAAWGVTDRLTLSAQLPFVRRDGLREAEHGHEGGVHDHAEVAALGNVSGIGDASLLAKFRIAGSGSSGFSALGGVKLPTGATRKRSLQGDRLETEHQPGTGSWDLYLGAAAGTRIGPLQVDASLLYQFSGKGSQETRLGDRLQAGVALSRRFGPTNDHLEAHSDHGHASWDAFLEVTAEWEGRQRVAGLIEVESGGTAVWLQPGLRHNTAGGFSVGAAVGVPVWQDIRLSHPENNVRVIFSLSKAL